MNPYGVGMSVYGANTVKYKASDTEVWSAIQKIAEMNNITPWSDTSSYTSHDAYHVTFEFKPSDMEPYTAAQVAWNILKVAGSDKGIRFCGGRHVVINGKAIICVGETEFENDVMGRIASYLKPNRKNRIGVQVHIWKEA
jgi:hypothetical protein